MIAVTRLAVSAATLATAWVGPIFPASNPEPARPLPVQAVVQEDDPAWDCETMGNLVCGPVEVNLYTRGAYTYVEVWDAHNRRITGPVQVERIINEMEPTS